MRVVGLMTLLTVVACATTAPGPPASPPPPGAPAEPSSAAADSDGDGVVDRADRCPGDAETRNGYQDDDGCPDLSLRTVASASSDDPMRIVERIEFEYDSAAIKPTSFALLDAIGVVLKMQPQQFPIMALEGHAADNEHSPMKLSLARASAVRLALLARGVDESRLLARASGAMAPGCGEQTEICRAHERAVEFVKVAASRAAVAGEAETTRAEPDRAPEPTPPPAEKAAAVAIPLDRVEFKKGSAVLGPASQANLDLLAGFMKGTPAALEIVGYADDNERKPEALAQARADAVRRYMLACGVSGQYLTTRIERTGRAACRSHSATCSARDGRAELRFVEQAPAAPAPPKANAE